MGMSNPDLEKAFGILKPAAMAVSLGLSKQTMSDWRRAGRVPSHHAAAVEALTGVDRAKLCPGFSWKPRKPAAITAQPHKRQQAAKAEG